MLWQKKKTFCLILTSYRGVAPSTCKEQGMNKMILYYFNDKSKSKLS